LAWRFLPRVLRGTWLPLAVLVGVGALPQLATKPGAPFRLCQRTGQQECVIDGDTIRHGGVTIRLADIDAPETGGAKCTSEAALGARATKRLLELMNAGRFEVVHHGGRDEDRYGRKLRTIKRDGRSVSEALIAEGLVRPWDGARRSWCG
jgi:endonuclease YncB( thermonuclease family)